MCYNTMEALTLLSARTKSNLLNCITVEERNKILLYPLPSSSVVRYCFVSGAILVRAIITTVGMLSKNVVWHIMHQSDEFWVVQMLSNDLVS